MDIYDLVDQIQKRLENEVITLLEWDAKWQYTDSDFLKLFQHMKDILLGEYLGRLFPPLSVDISSAG